MPKKANKKQLLDWKRRIEASYTVMKVAQNLIDEVDEEYARIKSEMQEYGMLEDGRQE